MGIFSCGEGFFLSTGVFITAKLTTNISWNLRIGAFGGLFVIFLLRGRTLHIFQYNTEQNII